VTSRSNIALGAAAALVLTLSGCGGGTNASVEKAEGLVAEIRAAQADLEEAYESSGEVAECLDVQSRLPSAHVDLGSDKFRINDAVETVWGDAEKAHEGFSDVCATANKLVDAEGVHPPSAEESRESIEAATKSLEEFLGEVEEAKASLDQAVGPAAAVCDANQALLDDYLDQTKVAWEAEMATIETLMAEAKDLKANGYDRYFIGADNYRVDIEYFDGEIAAIKDSVSHAVKLETDPSEDSHPSETAVEIAGDYELATLKLKEREIVPDLEDAIQRAKDEHGVS
jgi:hypothetical protein